MLSVGCESTGHGLWWQRLGAVTHLPRTMPCSLLRAGHSPPLPGPGLLLQCRCRLTSGLRGSPGRGRMWSEPFPLELMQ